MATSPTALAGDLQQGASLLQDVIAAYQAHFASIAADEAVVADAVQIAAMIDPALAPAVMILPIAEALVAWVAANDQSAKQNGGVIGALMDSLAGVRRPVVNADGSDLTQS